MFHCGNVGQIVVYMHFTYQINSLLQQKVVTAKIKVEISELIIYNEINTLITPCIRILDFAKSYFTFLPSKFIQNTSTTV